MPAIKELSKMTVEERSKLKWNDPRLLYVASKIAEKNDVPPAVLLAILHAENSYFDKKTGALKYSNNDSHAVSQAGAEGVMQMMKNTREKLRDGLFKHNVLDPVENLDASARYLKETIKQYKGNYAAVIADYNGGPKQAAYVMGGSLPKAPETNEYVKKAMENLRTFKIPETEADSLAPVGAVVTAAAPVAAPQEQSFIDKVKRVAPPFLGGEGEMVSKVF